MYVQHPMCDCRKQTYGGQLGERNFLGQKNKFKPQLATSLSPQSENVDNEKAA